MVTENVAPKYSSVNLPSIPASFVSSTFSRFSLPRSISPIDCVLPLVLSPVPSPAAPVSPVPSAPSISIPSRIIAEVATSVSLPPVDSVAEDTIAETSSDVNVPSLSISAPESPLHISVTACLFASGVCSIISAPSVLSPRRIAIASPMPNP